MRPKNYPASRVTQKGERTFAYRCPYKDLTHRERCDNKNVHGNTLDEAVSREVTALAGPDAGMVPMLEELQKQIAGLCQGHGLWNRSMTERKARSESW